MKKIILGIDLGTTTSIITYLKDGKPTIIDNSEGSSTTDSVVSVDKSGNIIVGARAKRSFEGIREIKRLMGTSEKVSLGGKEYSPEEISAEILKKLKKDAETYLGQEIEEAVISVPAMFTSKQKSATIEAGKLAGFKVERLIDEPTAAALAYGYENLDKKCKILVYDFGGGTFDVSILDFQDGVLEVLATDGDNHLGGKDMDAELSKYIIMETEKHSNLDDRDIWNIILKSEEVRKDLSVSTVSEYLDLRTSSELEISREKLENLISGFIDKSMKCIDRAFEKSKITSENIDVVLLVGGTTRIPLVKKRLEEKFGNKVKHFLNPQLVVAMGAAVQGAMKSKDISPENQIIITENCNYSLGIGMIHGKYSKIINANTVRPCENTETYVTTSDNQTSVLIEVYQGEDVLVKDNECIGEFSLKGFPKNKAGKESLDVTFRVNVNDVVEVEAKINSTGVTKVYQYSLGGKAVLVTKEPEKKSETSNSGSDSYKNSPLYEEYKSIMTIAEKKLKSASEEDAEKVSRLLEEMKTSLVKNDQKRLDQLDVELTDLIFEI